MNWVVGWLFLLGTLAATAVLDPWLIRDQALERLSASQVLNVRHAQGVLLGMAFLQLAAAYVLRLGVYSAGPRRIAATLTALGAVIYSAGGVAIVSSSFGAVLVPLGSLLNLAGFAVLLFSRKSSQAGGELIQRLRFILAVLCFGMILDLACGVAIVHPDWFRPTYLGASDELRLRMLRLARVAAIALSVLNLLYEGLSRRSGTDGALVRIGRWAMLVGAVGMPLVLAAACFTWIELKYLLPVPATAVVTGVLIGLSLSLAKGSWLERWGWSLIAVSTLAGMGIGFYAFDGPLPSPAFMGNYGDLTRSLTRLVHSYIIVVGLLSIFLARQLDAVRPAPWPCYGLPIAFCLGCAVFAVILIVAMLVQIPVWLLALGPLAILAATCGVILLHPAPPPAQRNSS